MGCDAGVARCAHERLFAEFRRYLTRNGCGKPKIDQNNIALVVAHDVLRFQVLMQHPFLVDILEYLQDFHSKGVDGIFGEWLVALIFEAGTEELHFDVVAQLPLSGVKHLGYSLNFLELLQNFRFRSEAGLVDIVGGKFDFEGDLPLGETIVGLVNETKTALSDPPQDVVLQVQLLVIQHFFIILVLLHRSFLCLNQSLLLLLSPQNNVMTSPVFLPTTIDEFLALAKKNPCPTRLPPASTNIQINTTGDEAPKLMRRAGEVLDVDSEDEGEQRNLIEKVVYSDYQRLMQLLENSKFDALVAKTSKEIQRIKQEVSVRVLNTNKLMASLTVQSNEKMNQLQKALDNQFGRRNLQLINSILSINKFFTILSKENRARIFENCAFLRVEQGEEVYREGDVQDFMYVVVKGCIRQEQKKTTAFNEKLTVNVISHYEGSSFGEVQLIGEKDQLEKRHHTTIAAEKSCLLKIDNIFYRQLITNSEEADFERKINSLVSTSIFSQTSKIFVTPLISALDKRILRFGEVLVRQGEPVRKLYFIGEGSLKLVYMDRSKRNVEHLNIVEKPVNFQTRGERRYQQKKNYSIHKTFYYAMEQPNEVKEFVYGRKKLVNNQLEYNDEIVFEEIREGNFLGGKSFLSSKQKEKKSEDSIFFDPSVNAKLTVVGSSTQTILYILEEEKFNSLSDNMQKVIVQGLLDSTYFDERDIESKIQHHREWKKYSERLAADVIGQKKLRSQSFRV